MRAHRLRQRDHPASTSAWQLEHREHALARLGSQPSRVRPRHPSVTQREAASRAGIDDDGTRAPRCSGRSRTPQHAPPASSTRIALDLSPSASNRLGSTLRYSGSSRRALRRLKLGHPVALAHVSVAISSLLRTPRPTPHARLRAYCVFKPVLAQPVPHRRLAAADRLGDLRDRHPRVHQRLQLLPRDAALAPRACA